MRNVGEMVTADMPRTVPHAPATTGWKLVTEFSWHVFPPNSEGNEPAISVLLENVTGATYLGTLRPLGTLDDAWIKVTVC